MADLEQFRQDTRAWLEENGPESIRGMSADPINGVWGGRRGDFAHPDQKIWLERMGAKGWTAPTWPAEFGGGGLSKAEAKVLAEEMRALKLPPALIGFGLTMIGPTLLQFGTDDQKKEHLPPIVRGEIRWCQGYSEPGAGSDLASLATKAEDDGDGYVLNGTKVWTSYADKADWIFALVRTGPVEPKHDGITFLLLDMDSPGVSVSPIKLISGSSPFCETHFENARALKKNVILGENKGWTVAKALLGHERSMIADAFGAGGGKSKSARGRLVDMAADYLGESSGGVLDDAIVRDEIVQAEMDTRAFGLTVQRSKDNAKAGHMPGAETSMFKIYGTELNQRRHELMVRIAGPQSLGWEGPGFDDEELTLTRDWLRTRGNTIEGGTSEVQLNIIAKRVLGLPD